MAFRAAIYFDGYLPASKNDVRLQRLVESSTASNTYFLATKSGIPRDGGSAPSPHQAHPRIPVPAFIVPTILEALRTSERYSHLTHLVPGEADCFCADHVSREGGALLTSDSDLLLYDLGQDGSVVFLNDIEITAEESEPPLVLTYSPRAICKRLSLEPGQQGILSLAFEIKMDPYQKIAFCVMQSKKNHMANANPAEYADFISEYVKGSDSGLAIPDFLRFLDPRVSEFILSWTGRAGPTEVSNPVGSTFYLPLLLDRWDYESAWGPSTWIRQLAYSLCPETPPDSLMVAEYRRTMSRKSNGQSIELFTGHEITETAQRLVSLCKTFNITAAARGPSHLRWAMFCLKQETTHSLEQGKEPLVKKVLQKASKSRGKGRIDPGNWDTVHLTAQIQGTLYSLRILHQVLKFRAGHLVGTAWPQLPVSDLLECLSTLPTIENFPSTIDVADLLVQRTNAGQLKELLDVAGQSEAAPSEGTWGPFERNDRLAGELKQKRRRQRRSANPFDALSPSS